MDIITGYTGKKHITAEKDRDINIGIVGGGSYVLCTGMQMKAEISTNNEIKIRDGVIMHQGCAASIKKNTYDSVTIINGSQGMKRIDLIVARYERNKDTNVESLELVALQGEPAESDPAVPDFVVGDIQEGDYVADMPLYQVMIDGLNIVEVKQVFELAVDLKTVKEAVTKLNGKYKDYTLLGSGNNAAQTVSIDISGYDYLYCYMDCEPVHNINPTLVCKDLLADGNNQLMRMYWSPDVGALLGTVTVSGNYITRIYTNKDIAFMRVYGVK